MRAEKIMGAAMILAAGLGASPSGMAQPGPEVAQGNAGLQIRLSLIGRYDSGIRGQGGAEIVAHDAVRQRLFVINAAAASVDVLDISNPAAPALVQTLSESGGDANSVAVKNGLVAVAFAASPKTLPGKVVFYDAASLQRLAEFTVGALPDMLTFIPGGEAVLVANEGEPSGYAVPSLATDPEGSVSVIDLRAVSNPLDAAALQAGAVVRTAGFGAFNGAANALRASGIRIYGPGATVAQDLEPEYIAVAPDARSARVTLQEANAFGELDLSDLANPRFTRLIPLGFKDHLLAGNELDASDRDNAINIRSWPVKGLYQPDAIASYSIQGKTYYVTANEGDDRNDFIPGGETVRVSGIPASSLDAAVFGDVAALRSNVNLGRLTVTQVLAPRNGAGQFTELHVLGARSFSIWNAEGQRTFDSGADFERITAARFPAFFNTSNDNNALEDRSDNKGPEPEGIAIGKIRGRTFAFIGLERIGGVMAYDISNPAQARFVDYLNTRDFTVLPNGAATNDSGPEGVIFIAADDSPTGKPLLAVGNEVSGTTIILGIDVTGK